MKKDKYIVVCNRSARRKWTTYHGPFNTREAAEEWEFNEFFPHAEGISTEIRKVYVPWKNDSKGAFR